MKILICTTKSTYTSDRVGGAETSLRLIAEHLAERGHDVTYLAKGDRTGLRIGRQKIKGVTVVLYSCIESRSRMKLLRGVVHRINGWWLDFVVFRAGGIREIDIVHVYYQLGIVEYFLALRRRKGLGYKIVMRMAGLLWYEEILKNGKKLRRYKSAFENIDAVNYISEGLRSLVQAAAGKAGLDLKFKHEFTGDIGVALRGDGPVWQRRAGGDAVLRIIVATRFSTYQKRQDILVEAARLLQGKLPFHLTLIGSGDAYDVIKNKVTEYGLDDCITLKPYMEQKALWREMAASDILCHPCDYEGLSKIIIESMLLGLPVMASDVAPLNLYIKDGVTGYLCANSPGDWAAGLERIYRNQDVHDALSLRAFDFACKNYNAAQNVELYEKEFLKLITG